jgi:hypothetical protein
VGVTVAVGKGVPVAVGVRVMVGVGLIAVGVLCEACAAPLGQI